MEETFSGDAPGLPSLPVSASYGRSINGAYCPLRSLVPRFSADSLVKWRRFSRTCATILFKRLQFFMPLLGRNHNTNLNKKTSKAKKNKQKISLQDDGEPINPNAAGIDIGSREHYVCVLRDRAANPVRPFGTFTCDLEAMADWLKTCGVNSVAMEATGVYWITATAHKLARTVYRLLKYGEAYVRQGADEYEKKFQDRKLTILKKSAKAMGFELIEKQALPS
jgi:hypothetical protein